MPTTVNLDGTISRESLRYHADQMISDHQKVGYSLLRLKDLASADYRRYLRKLDFHHASNFWSPEQCVDLLTTLVAGDVIPSIVMWDSPHNGYEYVIDGGQRISIAIAWLTDNWDAPPDNVFFDAAELRRRQAAAHRVRELIVAKIGRYADYEAAGMLFMRIIERDGKPEQELNPDVYSRAAFYMKVITGEVGFAAHWVRGDYDEAEAAFVRINKMR